MYLSQPSPEHTMATPRESSSFAALRRLFDSRIAILDGAMGTMIQGEGLEEKDFRGTRFASHPKDLKGNNDLLSLTRPDVIERIHGAYFAAGADIVETNTFNSTVISQADYGMEAAVPEINAAAVKAARSAAAKAMEADPGRPRFVAGAIGPLNRTLSMSPDVNRPDFRAVTWDQVVNAYLEQARALAAAGADALLIETIFDTLNAKAALFATELLFDETGMRLPVMVSVTITDASGRTLSGQTISAFYTSIAHARPFSVGINCALGGRQMRPYVEELSSIAQCYPTCHPNAGPAERLRRLRRDAGGHGGSTRGVRFEWLAQHGRRLLRLDARAHRRRGGGRAPIPAAQHPRAGDGHAPERARAAHHRLTPPVGR